MNDAFEYHKKNDLYEPTKLVCRNNIKGINKLFIKDESDRQGLKAFKIVGVSYAVYCLEKDGILKKGDTVTTMTDGNHGAAVAFIANQRGYKAIIFVPENMKKERIETIKGYGAEVRIVDGGYDDSIEVVKKEADKNGWILISDTAWKDYEDIPKNIATGYCTIFNEVCEKLKEDKITHIFLQAGVGGFAASGVAYAVSRMNPTPKLICVEPDDADCIFENVKNGSYEGDLMCRGRTDSIMSGLNCGVPSSVTYGLLRDFVSAYVCLGDAWARKGVRMLYHDVNRVFSGESGAAGFAGLLACLDNDQLKNHLQLDENSNVLVVNTEGVTDKESFNKIVDYDFFLAN